VAPEGRRYTAGVLLLLAFAIAIAYWNSLSIDFQFDDSYQIVANPSLRSLRNVPRFFYDPTTASSTNDRIGLRPVLLATYALNYAVSGLQPWSYHVLQMILHFVAAALVFVIVRDHLWWPAAERGPLGRARIPAAACAFFFALAPLNSHSLDYMSARSAILTTCLYLGAFLAFLRGRLWAMALLHAAALMTKEIAATFPLAILLYEVIYGYRARGRSVPETLPERPGLGVPLAVAVSLDVAFAVYRKLLIPGWSGETYPYGPWAWFMSGWAAYVYYVRLFLWPDALSVDHDFPIVASFSEPRAWLSLLVLLVWVGLAWRVSKRWPQVGFATGWFLLTLAVESTFIPLGEVVNDHRPYIGTALGLSLLLAWVLDRVTAPLGARRHVAFGAASALLCAAALPVIWHRNWIWQDSVRLWVDTVEKGPGNGRAWMNAGVAFMGRGDMASARRYFEEARRRVPAYPYLYWNLAVLESHEKNFPDALVAADEGIRLLPGSSRSRYYRGMVLEGMGRVSEATDEYRLALSLDRGGADAAAGLARLEVGAAQSHMQAGLAALYERQDPTGAIAEFQQVLAVNPEHYGAHYQIAVALDRAQRPREARRHWETVLELARKYGEGEVVKQAQARLATPDVDEVTTWMEAGLKAMYQDNDPRRAADSFRRVLERNSTHYGATFQLAKALDMLGERDEARRLWSKVLAMAESYQDAQSAAIARERMK
jgi:protein O-mannosyl-transferase